MRPGPYDRSSAWPRKTARSHDSPGWPARTDRPHDTFYTAKTDNPDGATSAATPIKRRMRP